MKKISILGCGWLGLPLAKVLLENNFAVNGSTTSENKLPILKSFGISPFLISLNENEIIGDFNSFISNSEVLIVDVPPKLRGNEKENFVAKIQNTIPFIENSTIKNVLFVSSTSVYADDDSIVTENTICLPETEGGKQLLLAENILKSNLKFNTTVLRFGGLIGENRHPIRFLAGRKNIENPESPVNLIHQDDCIAIILQIIDHNIWDETFNAAAPFHEKRKDYYTKKAIEFGLQLPEFNYEKKSIGKTIDSNKLIQLLDFEFKGI
jgi:nucleoside-diphosphate-sugar epimerase